MKDNANMKQKKHTHTFTFVKVCAIGYKNPNCASVSC